MKSPLNYQTGPMACAILLATVVTVSYANNPEIEGPRSGRLPFSPSLVANIQASPDSAQDETGRMMQPGVLPAPVWIDGSASGTKIALLRIASPAAAAYRVHFGDVHLAEGARMFVYGVDDSGTVTVVHGPYLASGPLSGDPFRSGIVPGAMAVIEVQSPETVEWPFRIEGVNSMDAVELQWLRRVDHPGLKPAGGARGNRAPGYACVVDGFERKCELRGNSVVLEGDIVVEDLTSPPNPAKSKRNDAFAKAYFGGNWPNGRIPYVINANLQPDDPRIAWAVNLWNAAMPGVLVARTNETDYVEFRAWNEDFCQSSVGHIGGGAQYIDLADGCGRGRVAHEIGHALGLRHEHMRLDRGYYVIINWDNIEDGKRDQFEIPATGELVGVYDYTSIMHYGAYSFSKNGKKTIQTWPQPGLPFYPFIPGLPVGVPVDIPIGQRSALTPFDIAGAEMVQCVSTTRPVGVQVPPEGGNYRIDFTMPSYCSWTASSPSFWVTLTSGVSGQGSGHISISVAANPVAHQRTTYIKVGRNQVAVLQGARL